MYLYNVAPSRQEASSPACLKIESGISRCQQPKIGGLDRGDGRALAAAWIARANDVMFGLVELAIWKISLGDDRSGSATKPFDRTLLLTMCVCIDGLQCVLGKNRIPRKSTGPRIMDTDV